MGTIATSVKLSSELKARVDKLATKHGKTSHAFLIAAIEEHVARGELAEQFLKDAIATDVKTQRSGVGHEAVDVHAYVTAKVRGKKVQRPKPKRWRE